MSARSASRDEAWKQLSARLRDVLPPDVRDRLVGGTHTENFAENLVSGLTQAQITELREQLAAGGGNELRLWPSGKRTAHAPYSSAALAINAFGRWLGDETLLWIAGLTGFNHRLRIEAKLRIAHGAGTANLDVLLRGPSRRVVGVESKLTETLAPHPPTSWKPPYAKPAMLDLLEGGWRTALEQSLAGDWQPPHLGLEQLVKHALALKSARPDDERHLVYCYWEPSNGDEVPEVVQHRKELRRLKELLDEADPHFHAISYQSLFEEWAQLPKPDWLSDHVSQLEQRYGNIEL